MSEKCFCGMVKWQICPFYQVYGAIIVFMIGFIIGISV